MGVLGHYFEAAGLPTTQISLVREHTVRIRPPRALWVPFELGRPLGPPGDAAFQTRVLTACLELLEAREGPVLADYPEETPETGGKGAAWVCPLPLPKRPSGEAENSLGDAFADELAKILPWYALAMERSGRTTVGLSGLTPPEVGSFLRSLIGDAPAEAPCGDLPLGMAVKHAAEDLKAIYGEAIAAQPGRAPQPAELERWFWRETRAGALLRSIAARHATSDDPMLAAAASFLLVPFAER